MDDVRDIWNAVKARFGGNAESKKMRKSMLKQEFSEFRISEAEGLHKGYDTMQKILSQLNQLKAKPEDEDINLKFLRALPSSWSQVALTLKTKGRLELLSFDDLYYKLKTLEVDIKGYSTFSLSQSAGPERIQHLLDHQLLAKEILSRKLIGMMILDKKDLSSFNKKKVRCYKCLQRGPLFARECRAKGRKLTSIDIPHIKIQIEIGKKEEDSQALILLIHWFDLDRADGSRVMYILLLKSLGMIAGCDMRMQNKKVLLKIY
ncbi:hypothetical protein Tco_0216582 [Tanacetum coccineum]